MKEQQTPYTIQHHPAHHGPGRYDEHWTLNAMASGHGLTTHPTREAAQTRADELFGPTPLATLTIKVFADRTQVHAVAAKGAEPRKVLDQAITALRAEISDLAACPFHTPSQRLDAATVERAGDDLVAGEDGLIRAVEAIIGDLGSEDMDGYYSGIVHRSDVEHVEKLIAAIRSLATEPHSSTGVPFGRTADVHPEVHP